MRHGAPRTFVTGIGPVSGFGLGIDPLWKGLCDGVSAIRPITAFDASGFVTSVAATILPEHFDIRSIVPKSHRKATKVMARDIEIAVAAAHTAVHSAGLTTKGTAEGVPPTIPPDRFGCHIGAGLIPADADELACAMFTSRTPDGKFDPEAWGRTGMPNLTPLWLLKYLPNMLACHVTIIHDCQGPSNTITCAEASGGLSIGESLRVIRRGDATACLSGGAESKVNYMGMLRQTFAQRLARVPAGASGTEAVLPFDPTACGTVLGEGGGMLILETEASATGRGARTFAEIAGFGASQCCCIDTVGGDLSGAGEDIAAALECALDDAQVRPEAIDAVVPFGSGIPSIDAAEADALRRVFGARAGSLPLVTIAPQAGICGAGASALAACVGAKCVAEQKLPARLNTKGSKALGVDADARAACAAQLRCVVVMTSGMGGQTAAIVMRRVP
ncbi:MAG: hypothetical protein EXS03_05735 [Phycisphaerales bacterium]|nr:hypothetical protein [Phycisphaerales bacterium]